MLYSGTRRRERTENANENLIHTNVTFKSETVDAIFATGDCRSGFRHRRPVNTFGLVSKVN